MHPPAVRRSTPARASLHIRTRARDDAASVTTATRASRFARVGLVLALALAAPPLAAALLAGAGLPASPATLVACWLAIALWTWRTDAEDAPLVLGWAAATVTLALASAALVFDLSFDGQTYHQLAVRRLAAGWNPVWDARAMEGESLHVFSLPKAAWLLEAMLMRATGSLEAAKGVQAVAMAAAFLLARGALEALGVGRRAALAAALLAALNPVALTQLPTFYVDGLVASALVMLASLLVLAWRTGARRWGGAAAIVAAFAVNLKFTAGVLVALVLAALLVAAAWRARPRLREAVLAVGAAAALGLAAGINPYLTNTLAHGHPAYPARGPDAVPYVMVVHRDPTFAAQPAALQLARSLWSRSDKDETAPPRWKLPLTVHGDELASFDGVDTRIGGWGPLVGGALLLAWGSLLWSLRARPRRGAVLLAVSLATVLSALVIPAGFYSRYAPQLWLASLPALLIDELAGWRSRLLAAVLALNVLLVGGVSLGAQLVTERTHRAQLRALAEDARGAALTYAWSEAAFPNVDLHLAAYGLEGRAVERPGCAAPALLLKTHALLCWADGRSPAPTPDPRARAQRLLGRQPARPAVP